MSEQAAVATGSSASARSGKIRTLSELERILQEARSAGQRITLCHGVFDIVHPGHILHFKQAREQGDLLVVTITSDHYVRKVPGRPVFNQRLRLETIAALEGRAEERRVGKEGRSR